jgi:hypothetical protein
MRQAVPSPSTGFAAVLTPQQLDDGYVQLFDTLLRSRGGGNGGGDGRDGMGFTDAEFAERFSYETLLALDAGLAQRGGLDSQALRRVLRRTRRSVPADACCICLTSPGAERRNRTTSGLSGGASVSFHHRGEATAASDTGAVVVVLPCQHVYHPNCIRPWLQGNTTCPMCRVDCR